MDFAILEELLDMRERLNGLIHCMNRDLGLSLDKGSQAHHYAKGGGWSSVKGSQAHLSAQGSGPGFIERSFSRAEKGKT